MQTFGEQLTTARKSKGMTQEALAQAAAVTRQTVSSWERGRTIPDIDMIRRLSEILGTDLIPAAEGQSAAPAAEAVPEVEGQTAPAAAGKRQIRKWWIAAGAAVLVCVAVSCFLLFSRKGAPTVGGDGFNAQYYQQETANEAGKAYLTFENRVWEETGDSDVYQRYDFTMYEKNGIPFSVSRIEMQLLGKSGKIPSITYGVNDLKAADIDPDIQAFGSLTISGGFPKGEFLRAGVAVYGNDANGAPNTFYDLIEF